jgi:hypothetical protein
VCVGGRVAGGTWSFQLPQGCASEFTGLFLAGKKWMLEMDKWGYRHILRRLLWRVHIYKIL